MVEVSWTQMTTGENEQYGYKFVLICPQTYKSKKTRQE